METRGAWTAAPPDAGPPRPCELKPGPSSVLFATRESKSKLAITYPHVCTACSGCLSHLAATGAPSAGASWAWELVETTPSASL